jgi:hypothetical protein
MIERQKKKVEEDCDKNLWTLKGPEEFGDYIRQEKEQTTSPIRNQPLVPTSCCAAPKFDVISKITHKTNYVCPHGKKYYCSHCYKLFPRTQLTKSVRDTD